MPLPHTGLCKLHAGGSQAGLGILEMPGPSHQGLRLFMHHRACGTEASLALVQLPLEVGGAALVAGSALCDGVERA